MSDFNGLTIDAIRATPSPAPDVPQSARDEAVGRAINGEHITKGDAEAMIAKAR